MNRASVTFLRAAETARVPAMNAITARNEVIKWVASFVACFVIGIVIYFGAVFSMYLLGWVVELFGMIFG